MLLNQVYKGLNNWWLYLAGISFVIIGYMLGQVPLTLIMYYKLASNPNYGKDELNSFTKNMDFGALGIDKNIGFILLILMFIFALGFLWIVIKYFHKKRMIDLVTPDRPVNVNKILYGFGLWMGLNIILEIVNYVVSPGDYTFRGLGGSFFFLLLIAVFLLPIQTSFEELFFRGYIMQGLAYFSKNKWVAVVVSSILFGLIHGMNPEIEQYGFWPMQTYYISAGLFLALITVMDDSLELALGVHAATNFFGATFLTYHGSVLQTDTLFITSEINPWAMLFGFIISAIAFVYICAIKFNWPPLSELLNPEISTTIADRNKF
jgi:membrane protease YdiL (CAAX protease family)